MDRARHPCAQRSRAKRRPYMVVNHGHVHRRRVARADPLRRHVCSEASGSEVTQREPSPGKNTQERSPPHSHTCTLTHTFEGEGWRRSESVMAAERLHQRERRANGEIKTGTAGTRWWAEPLSCEAIVPYVLHLRLSEPLAKHAAGRPPPSPLIGGCHGNAVSRR